VTHLAARQHTTARSRREHLYAVTSELPAGPEDEEEDAVKRVLVQQALGRLPIRQRRAVYLRFWHGLTTLSGRAPINSTCVKAAEGDDFLRAHEQARQAAETPAE
jgi:hypothetical protein